MAVLVTAGLANIVNLWLISFSLWIQGLRNAAPYFLTATVSAVIAVAARHGFALVVSDKKQWLAVVSLTTLFAIYAAVFQKELRGYLKVFMSRGKLEDLGSNAA